MATNLAERRAAATGDVIELVVEGEVTSALVLLATPDGLIADPCDGRTPFVLDRVDAARVRVFRWDDLVA